MGATPVHGAKQALAAAASSVAYAADGLQAALHHVCQPTSTVRVAHVLANTFPCETYSAWGMAGSTVSPLHGVMTADSSTTGNSDSMDSPSSSAACSTSIAASAAVTQGTVAARTIVPVPQTTQGTGAAQLQHPAGVHVGALGPLLLQVQEHGASKDQVR